MFLREGSDPHCALKVTAITLLSHARLSLLVLLRRDICPFL